MEEKLKVKQNEDFLRYSHSKTRALPRRRRKKEKEEHGDKRKKIPVSR